MSKPLRTVQIVCEGSPQPRWRPGLARLCAAAAREAGFAEWDIAILLCGDETMAGLNGRYRGKEKPTDVLSFAREARLRPGFVTGDVAISLETLRRNARRFGVTADEELARLVVHAILHLAGMDHGPGKGGEMARLQKDILASMGARTIMGTGTGEGKS